MHGVKTSEKQVQFLGKLHALFALKAKIRKSSLKLMFFQKKKFLTKTVSKGLMEEGEGTLFLAFAVIEFCNHTKIYCALLFPFFAHLRDSCQTFHIFPQQCGTPVLP